MMGWIRRWAAEKDHEAMLRQRVDTELLNRVVKRHLSQVRREARRVSEPTRADAAEAVAVEAEQRSRQFMINAIALWHARLPDGRQADERRYAVVQEYLRWRDYMNRKAEELRRHADQAK
ncbi:hypothetical protein [Streptomyces sp. NPDC006134]|uniref:hypothetical protein n=1 Tax=Streptomyces sp. NPDC006134 TaxID=3154467 RepID=UPI0033CD0922